MRTLLMIVFAAFGVYSGYTVWEVGYVGILRSHLSNAGGIQVLCDLTISLCLLCAWIAQDARIHGRKSWPFMLATLFLGSFGPMLYLLLRPRAGRSASASAAVAAELIH